MTKGTGSPDRLRVSQSGMAVTGTVGSPHRPHRVSRGRKYSEKYGLEYGAKFSGWAILASDDDGKARRTRCDEERGAGPHGREE